MTTTSCLVSEIAARLDMSPGDVIEAAWGAGIAPLWLDGERFYDGAYLATVTGLHGTGGDVQFDASEQQVEAMAEVLMVETEEITGVRS